MLDEATEVRADVPTETKSNRAARRAPVYLTHSDAGDEGAHRQAEQFYLQKQIQAQTPMVIVLEDGTQVEGVIEWYDRNCLKLRGRERTLVYKSAIKYMYKHGENAL